MTTPREIPSSLASARVDGSARPGGQAAGLDVLPDRPLDLLVQRQLGVALDLDQQPGPANWTL